MGFWEREYQVRKKNLKCEIYVNIIVRRFPESIRVILYNHEVLKAMWIYLDEIKELKISRENNDTIYH